MPWRLVLLWLCIALLPLRGWASLALPASGVPAPGIAAHHHSAAPCHGVGDSASTLHGQAQMEEDERSGEAEDGTAHRPSAGTCALCDFCHGILALPSLAVGGFSPLNPGAPPVWTPVANGRLAIHELFRPPRS